MSTALNRVADRLTEAAGIDVALERPSQAEHGDYATNVALRVAPNRRVPPMDVAEEIAVIARNLADVESATAERPGFVNLIMARQWYGEALGEILAFGLDYGGGSAAKSERIQVELVSANPTGPVTVASARNAAYGESVARLLEFAGHRVEREYYVNDLGEQIDRFRASVAARSRGEEPPEDGYHGEYVAQIAAAAGDPVEEMVRQIGVTLERFRVEVDSWVRQSEIEEGLDEAIKLLPLYEEDGARWLRTTEWGDDKNRVLIRSDGRPTYFAADTAYIRNKFERGFDRLIYVLGADHHGYVKRLKALAAAYGRDPETVEVLIYQLVQLTEQGETRKISKRRGDIVILDELIDEIGVDAARWYLVMRGHDQPIDIDIDLARERSDKNPVYYVQYAHARIAGILRNADGDELAPVSPSDMKVEEKDLIKRLIEFPGVVEEAITRRGPHAIPTYAIRLADDYHRFYHHHRVLGSDVQAFRLALCRATQLVIARCLDLIAVEAPRRM